jgi:hypothetical protein
LQLFSLQASSEPRGISFEVARFLAPILSAGAALTAFAAVLREQFQRYRLEKWSGHTIIAGLGMKGMGLIGRLEGKIAAIERDRNHESIPVLRRRGIPVVIGDARDPNVLVEAGVPGAKQLVVVCGEDASTTAVAAAAANVLRRKREGGLSLLVHVADSDLAQALALVEHAGVDYRFFSFEDNAVSSLLDRHPVPQPARRRQPIVYLCGSGRLAQRLVVHIGRSRLAGGLGRVTVVHEPHDAEAWAELATEAPFLSGTVTFRARARDARADIAYVCMDDDAAGATAALELAAQRIPEVVVALSSNQGMAQLLAASDAATSGRLRTFGVQERMLEVTSAEGGLVDQVARAMHAAYRERMRALQPDDPAATAFDDLPADLQASNRHAAHAMVRALREHGWVLVPLADRTATEAELSAEMVEALARAEHGRWCEERTEAGWTLGPRDVIARRSPHLIPFGKLPADVRQRNRDDVRRWPSYLLRAGVQLVPRA